MSSSSSGFQGPSLLRIAMPVASSLILAYYIFTLPMSFLGGGGGGADVAAASAVVQSSKVVTPASASPPPPPPLPSPSPPLWPPPALATKSKDPLNASFGKSNGSRDLGKQGEELKKQAQAEQRKQKPQEVEDKIDVAPIPDDDVDPSAPAGDRKAKVVPNQGRVSNAENDPAELLPRNEASSEEDQEQQQQQQQIRVPLDQDTGLGTEVFHSLDVFKRNYREMERRFKIFIYPDGDPNTYFQTPRKLTGKYASEGYFFQNLRDSKFVTRNPNKAHLFFIPISCHKMRGKGISYESMADIIQEYVELLVVKYPYWNRTLGADHFFVTCHDVGARATNNVPHLVKNSIRVVCSPSYDGDFVPHKDVAMPQVLQPFALPRGGNDVKNRTVLGFWAGHRNSKIRVNLAKLWENDTVLAISNNRISRATGELVYQKQFYRSKFCICPGGSQVNSARIADSIHYGCVPVILSDFYDLPFNDVLDWRKFSLLVRERDVGELKQTLQSVTPSQYLSLHKGLLQVQDRFEWHSPAKAWDAFHMVMYELWLRHFSIQYKK